MLAIVAATAASTSREVIVGIVGGTMLTIALTRPRLLWIERLTDESKSGRVWLERALTGFSFVMAGYAATTLLLELHKQLGAESDALLRGAALFLFAYAWLVHFEPFVREWRLRGGLAAVALYTGLIFPALVIGGTLAGVALEQRLIFAEVHLILLASVPAILGWLAYRFGEPLSIRTDRPIERTCERDESSPSQR
jgi:hypothetical protein